MSKATKSIVGSGGGGGKGGGGSRAAVEAPDSIFSKGILKVIDLIGEGEIAGLVDGGKSIFLNETPLISSAGQSNFGDVVWETRVGTPHQDVMKGFSDIETPYIVGVEVFKNSPQTFTISNPDTDRVRIIITIPSLFSVDTSNGDTNGATVEYRFEISKDSGAYTPFGDNIVINEKTRSKYQRAHVMDLPKPASSWSIKVIRVTDDSASLNLSNRMLLDTYVEIIDLKLNYPNSALVSVELNPEQFSSVPKRGYHVHGLIIKVPSNYDPVTRLYNGVWDGTFKTAYSNNPAWVLYDLLVTKRYGIGDYVAENQINIASLYKVGRYCDELVKDGYGGMEPRFTINTVISTRVEAYKLINNITSVFRGMSYWYGGTIGLSQDSPQSPSMIFSQANVKDGVFNYTSSAKKDRHSVVLVTWNNPANNFKQEIEYVENQEMVNTIGVKQLEIVAFGCASRGQAYRAGKWVLYTEQYESNVISFSVGADSSLVIPGEIIKIHDAFKAGKRFGGRIIGVNASGSQLELDSAVAITGNEAVLSVKMPDGSIADTTIMNGPGQHNIVDVSPALTDIDLTAAMFVITEPSLEPQLARVIGIAEGQEIGEYVITAVEHNPSKFNAIDFDEPIYEPITSITTGYVHDAMAAPTGLAVEEIVSTSELGITRNLLITWDSSENPFIKSYNLYFKRDSDEPVKVTNLGFSYTIENVKDGFYHIEVVAKTTFGGFSAPAATDYTVVPLFAVLDVTVINLGVKGAGLEFMGRNAEIHWETDADTVLNLPISYSNGKGGSSKWFRDFEVKIFTADGETLLRTDYTTEYAYSYTFEKNVEDGGPRRTFKVEVRARDEFGDYSNPGSIVPYNHPPQAGAVIESIPKEGSISFKITPPDDPDYKYLRLFGSKTQGFTPDATPGTGNLLYEGAETYISFPIDYAHNGNWYLRVQFVDEFGVDGAIYSNESTQLVVATIADLEPNLASEILNVITDFNAGNNRNASEIVNPTIASDGTAIDHTLNADGTINISVEWDWLGNEATIDGFLLYAYISTDSAPHTFNGLAPDEIVFQLPASSRSYIHHGIPAYRSDDAGNRLPIYYTLGILAYRKVDPDVGVDIAIRGVIHSAIVTPSRAEENPYCPALVNPASGDITTTIDGILAKHVNHWDWITGSGRPWDNADVTKDQISGSGINILNSRYAVIDESAIPPYIVTGGTVALNNSATQFGLPAIRLTATSALAVLWLSGNTTDYNFIVTPNKKWLLSAYVRSAAANASGTLSVRGSDGNTYGFVEFLTSPTPNTWTRVSGGIDASANSSSLALLRLENDAGAGVSIDFTGLMMEELIGNLIAPSAFARPSISSIAGMPLDQVYGHIVDFTASNNRNNAAVAAPTVAADDSALDYSSNTDGSANISFQWSWSGNEGDIDGFAILAYTTNDNHGTYEFGTHPDKELVIQVPPSRRAYIATGVAANAYYTVAVCAFRAVDKDIAANGVINSTLSYANGPHERPFRPTATISFNGDVAGTLGGTSVNTVVNNTATALETAQNAINGIGAIISDGYISPPEKKQIRSAWDTIASEKATLESQGTTYGITTEKTAFIATLQALGNYLNTDHGAWVVGAIPYHITDAQLSVGFTIDAGTGAALRAVVANYYNARTALLNAITAEAAKRAQYSKVTGTPTSLSAINSTEGTKLGGIAAGATNTYVSGGILYGVSAGAGTAVGNSLITISASGTLSGAGGGQVTLSGMGAGSFATLNQLNASNIASFLAANSIGDTYLTSIAANKITAGSLAAGVIYSGQINASQINAGTINAVTLTASSITGTSGINISGVANFSGSGYNTITGDNAAINASSSVHGIVGATTNGSAYGVKAYNSGGGIALYSAGSFVINNSSLVYNLNAQYHDGFLSSAFCRLIAGNNGTCNVSGGGFNLLMSTGLTSYEFYSAGNNYMYARSVSDRRLKTEIEPETLGLSFIKSLKPVTFRKKTDLSIKHHGFIADDFIALINSTNEDSLSMQYEDGIRGFDYTALIAPMVKAMQQMAETIEHLEQQLGDKNA